MDYGSHVVDSEFYAAESGFHAHAGFQSWVFLGIAKAILSSLFSLGVCIVQCLFNLVYYVTDVVIAPSPTPRN